MKAINNSQTAVHGESTGGTGVYGTTYNGNAIYGRDGSGAGLGYAGYFEGNVYVTANVSALSFTDRTPYPEDLATAYHAVMSMKRLPEGQYQPQNKASQLDHAELSDFIRSPDGHRDLSATVSCLNEVVKDLIAKNRRLESASDKVAQLHRENKLLEQRLTKLEAMMNQTKPLSQALAR